MYEQARIVGTCPKCGVQLIVADTFEEGRGFGRCVLARCPRCGLSSAMSGGTVNKAGNVKRVTHQQLERWNGAILGVSGD